MESIKIYTEYIKLDQLLKTSGVTQSGAESKYMILEGKVKVNGNVELHRGKKLRKGDTVEADNYTIRVE